MGWLHTTASCNACHGLAKTKRRVDGSFKLSYFLQLFSSELSNTMQRSPHAFVNPSAGGTNLEQHMFPSMSVWHFVLLGGEARGQACRSNCWMATSS